MSGASHEFDQAIFVGEDGSAEIHDGWDIGGNANGGYLIALAANGMRVIAERPHPITITAHYLAPGTAGKARVSGEVVKVGRRFTTVSGSLDGPDRRVLQVLGTFGDLNESHGDFRRHDGSPPDLPPPDDCPERAAANGPVPVGLMDKLDLRLSPESAAFARGETRDSATVEGWFGLADGRPIDPMALLLASDAFPPAVFNIDIPPGWVPTVELSVHLRAVPVEGPIRCRFRTRFIHGGMFEEDGELWDASDTLVAQSRQLALVPRT